MSGSPPLRFLAAVLVGWAAIRTALFAPLWWTPPADAAAAEAQARPRPGPDRIHIAPAPSPSMLALAEGRAIYAAAIPRRAGNRPGARRAAALPFAASAAAEDRPSLAPPAATASSFRPRIGSLPEPLPVRPRPGRWSLSAWAFVRQGDPALLAASGLLGGSQAGTRLVYRVNRDPGRPLALSARLSSSLGPSGGAEAALGIDWKPAGRLPVHLLAERRQALRPEGRSAFAATAYGGVADAPLGPFRIDFHGQAGIVGARSRDPFADGSLRVSLPLGGRTRLGAGVWGAAQPGLSRVDLGPQAAVRLRVAGRPLAVAADWRVRVAGNASPGSGPTLTVSTDF